MKNKQNQHGFTLAELLIVVAIIGVLAGVAFIAVQTHQEGLHQMELDTVAKEIFVAAQNHLTMARNENYMGLPKTAYGTLGTVATPSGELDEFYDKTAASDGMQSVSRDVYYYSVEEGGLVPETAAIATLILPSYALDAAVMGGNYLIRYQPSSGLVLDVFYSSRTGKYARMLPDYDSLMGLRGETKNGDRRSNHIGWYGGTAADSIPQGKPLEPPVLEVENGKKLIAKVTDDPNNTGEHKIALLVTGKISKAQQVFRLADGDSRVTNNATHYEIVIDDITTPGMHFAEIGGTAGTVNQIDFIPGEDIVLRAVAYNEKALSNIANSDEKIVNSLFEKAERADENAATFEPIKAYINNIRHLENLCFAVSNVNYSPGSGNPEAAGGTRPNTLIVEAVQTTDLKWDFSSTDQIYNTGAKSDDTTGIGKAGCLVPINMPATYEVKAKTNQATVPTAISYDGQHHSIRNISVDVDGNASAGLLGDLHNDSSVKDLALINFTVTSVSGSAGALAGTLTQSDALPKDTEGKDIPNVSNVVAYNTAAFDTGKNYAATITVTGNTNNAKGDAGGLIGKVISDKAVIEKSAASLTVSSAGSNAGGLIGTMEGGTLAGCYSGGHTKGGSYYNGTTAIYNVAASGDAGGLVGDAGATAITNSYSTCSAKGNKAGGLVGNTSGTINKCYSTGLVLGTGTNPVSAAFAVMADGATATNCNYYEIINELATVKRGDSAEEITVKMAEVQDGDLIQSIMYMVPAIKSDGTATADTVVINALDATAESYNEFVGTPEGKAAVGDNPAKPGWKAASPYDLTLADYYKVGGAARFNLKTVSKLGATGVKEKTGPTDTATVEDFVATHYGDWPAPEIFVVNTAKSGS